VSGEGWRLKAQFTFAERQPTIDEVDRVVGGRARGTHGGTSHAINSGPWRTELEWEFDTRDDAKAGLERASTVGVLHEPYVVPPRDRTLRDDEWQIRASQARAGRARCLSCGQRMPAAFNLLFALEGVAAGNEVVLRCAHCGWAMEWQILSEAVDPGGRP
jgi:hypothetical protein